jgi:hypothetical protein
MKKCVKCLLLLFLLTIVLLPQSAPGQAKITLEKGTGKKTSNSEVAAPSKIVKPSGQAELNSPVVLVQPSPIANNATAEKAKPNKQPTQAQARTSESLECSWTLLLLSEVGSYHLIITGVPCLGCNLPSELSQSTAGVLGFSHSPSGPWTETLTVYTQLDFSGNGTSENFYIKGLTPGASTFHAQNFWSSFNIAFQVVPCTCPEIPIVP